MIGYQQRLTTMWQINLLNADIDDEEFKKSGVTPVPRIIFGH